MIQLRVLGSADLRGPGGQPILSVLSQPKRLTLLTYLALNATGGFIRRDKLLGLFWPDSDTDKARASLRRSLSYLRSSLGEGVLVTRGSEEVGLAAGALECDAVRFAALARDGDGDHEAACALYGGPLLDGLFVSEAELERWLEDERNQLERLAVETAAGHADRKEQAGELPEALAWARRVIQIEPRGEAGMRRLIRLLGRSGDRDEAVRVYDEFTARLAAELELEPSEETKALIDDIRSSKSAFGGAMDVARAPIAAPVLREAGTVPVATPRRSRTGLPYAASLSLAALIIVMALWGWLRVAPAASDRVLRYSMVFPEGEAMMAAAGGRFALSPDGSMLAYAAGPERRLRARQRDQLHGPELPGTERARFPFFSPDGKRVGFFSNGVLKIASLAGGPIVDVANGLDASAGASWGPDGFLYASRPEFDGIVRLRPEPGAIAEPFTRLNSTDGESNHNYPDVLPNGRGVLFTIVRAGVTRSTNSIGVADLETGAHHVLMDGLFARYATSGHVLFVAPDSTLMVAPFDGVALKLTGPATVVSAKQRIGFRGAVDLAVSSTGTLVYATGPGEGARQLVWVSRTGTVEPVDTSWQGGIGFPTLSPDGTQLAVTMSSPNGADIWIRQMESGSLFRLTGEGTVNGYPSWTADGRSVTFFSNAGGKSELWTKPADGSAHASLQLSRPGDLAESHWSGDGAWLIYRTTNVPQFSDGSPSPGASDILAIRPGTDEGPIALATTEFTEVSPGLSPDGRWLAFSSNETGKEEVFVVPFPNTRAAKWSVSPDGGTEPVWSRRGGELFYKDARGYMHVVEVQTTPTFSVGRNTVMFDGRGFVVSGLHPMYTVSMDDQRLLMVRATRPPEPGELIVVENWFRELQAIRGK